MSHWPNVGTTVLSSGTNVGPTLEQVILWSGYIFITTTVTWQTHLQQSDAVLSTVYIGCCSTLTISGHSCNYPQIQVSSWVAQSALCGLYTTFDLRGFLFRDGLWYWIIHRSTYIASFSDMIAFWHAPNSSTARYQSPSQPVSLDSARACTWRSVNYRWPVNLLTHLLNLVWY